MGDIIMEKIEQLLNKNNGKNMERFSFLKEAAKRDRLAVFWGAGLSRSGRFSNKWSAPFEKMYNTLMEKNSPKRFHAKEVEAALCGANEAIIAEQYPLAGRKLNNAYDRLKDIYKKNGASTEFFPGKSFNQFLIESFDFNYEEVKNASFDKPYEIDSIFYLPFVGNRGITTNIDQSYNEAVARVGNKNILYAIHCDDTAAHILNVQNKDYAIHGLETESDTLVFTDAQYSKVYGSGNIQSGPLWLLIDTIKKYTILFLGASLKTDETVKVINEYFLPNTSPRLHLVPLCGGSKTKNGYEVLDSSPELEFAEPIIYNSGQYQEIAYMLLTLIRQVVADWSYCQWDDSALYQCDERISEELKKDISQLLSNDCSYMKLTVKDQAQVSPSPLIKYLYEHHSIEHHDSGNGWSICLISHYGFSLNGKKGSPVLHNYPLGDTIYIIAPSPKYPAHDLKEDDAEEIEKHIQQWRESLDSSSIIQPRVRVIIFPLRHRDKATEKERVMADRAERLLDILNQFECEIEDITDTKKTKHFKNGVKAILDRLRAFILSTFSSALADVEVSGNKKSKQLQRTKNE